MSFHAADITAPDPHFGWGIEDATADANVLVAEHGAVFVSYAGDVFVWGGKMDVDDVLDVGGHRAGRQAHGGAGPSWPACPWWASGSPWTSGRACSRRCRTSPPYSSPLGEAASMDVHLPQVVSTVLRHSVSIRFYDTVEAYELDVEVGHVEV